MSNVPDLEEQEVLKFLTDLTEEERTRIRVRRICSNLMDLLLFGTNTYYGPAYVLLGYKTFSTFKTDVTALYAYCGARIALDDPEALKQKKPRRRRQGTSKPGADSSEGKD